MVSNVFPQQKVSDEIKFQNASKRQIKIIYFNVYQNATTRLSSAIHRPILFQVWIWDADQFHHSINEQKMTRCLNVFIINL